MAYANTIRVTAHERRRTGWIETKTLTTGRRAKVSHTGFAWLVSRALNGFLKRTR
jgi:aminoglycoside phosphotransferase